MKDMQKKVFEIEELKVDLVKEDGEDRYYIQGYANTKGKPDSYGDIPTNFNGNPVYDLKRYKKNKVLLIDHFNSASCIAGYMKTIKEDDKGLFFRARLMNLEDIYSDQVKHAVSAFIKGFGRALSIGGRWLFEDDKNPTHLTKAIIHEISMVAVGADGQALTDTNAPKKIQDTKNLKADEAEKIKSLEKKHGAKKVNNIMKTIEELKK